MSTTTSRVAAVTSRRRGRATTPTRAVAANEEETFEYQAEVRRARGHGLDVDDNGDARRERVRERERCVHACMNEWKRRRRSAFPRARDARERLTDSVTLCDARRCTD